MRIFYGIVDGLGLLFDPELFLELYHKFVIMIHTLIMWVCLIFECTAPMTRKVCLSLFYLKVNLKR